MKMLMVRLNRTMNNNKKKEYWNIMNNLTMTMQSLTNQMPKVKRP
jgi:hypothetical protein